MFDSSKRISEPATRNDGEEPPSPSRNRRRRGSRNGQARNGATRSAPSTTSPERVRPSRPGQTSRIERGSNSESVKASGGWVPTSPGATEAEVEVPGRIVGEGPARPGSRPAARERPPGRRAGCRDRRRSQAHATRRSAASPRPHPRTRPPPTIATARAGRDERATRGPPQHRAVRPRPPGAISVRPIPSPDQGRGQDQEDLGVAQEDHRRADHGQPDQASVALDECPVGDPQHEQGEHERDGLRPVAIELLVEADRPEQEDRAGQRVRARDPAAEQDGGEAGRRDPGSAAGRSRGGPAGRRGGAAARPRCGRSPAGSRSGTGGEPPTPRSRPGTPRGRPSPGRGGGSTSSSSCAAAGRDARRDATG